MAPRASVTEKVLQVLRPRRKTKYFILNLDTPLGFFPLVARLDGRYTRGFEAMGLAMDVIGPFLYSIQRKLRKPTILRIVSLFAAPTQETVVRSVCDTIENALSAPKVADALPECALRPDPAIHSRRVDPKNMREFLTQEEPCSYTLRYPDISVYVRKNKSGYVLHDRPRLDIANVKSKEPGKGSWKNFWEKEILGNMDILPDEIYVETVLNKRFAAGLLKGPFEPGPNELSFVTYRYWLMNLPETVLA
jgi:hypothetical protein